MQIRAMTPGPTLAEPDDTATETTPILSGYASLWGNPTSPGTYAKVSNPREGTFIEVCRRGCWKRTITENRDKIRILWQHGAEALGLTPIADLTAPGAILEEDNIGLRYVAPMIDGTPEIITANLRTGAMGSSVGFRVIRENLDSKPKPTSWNPEGWPVREIIEAKLTEISVVTWGAFPDASAQVRSLDDEFAFRRLMDAGPERLQELVNYWRDPTEEPAATAPVPAPVTRRRKQWGATPSARWHRMMELQAAGLIDP